MTKREDVLPRLQKRILLLLAKKGPLTRNEIATTLKKPETSYKPVLYATSSLTTKGFVEIVDQKERSGRKFPLYWLTFNGSGLALLNDANPQKLRENALKANKKESDQKAIELYFSLREKASPEISRIFDEFILKHGKLETRELIKELLPSMLSVEPGETDKLMNAAREFPEWKYAKATLEKMREKIDRVLRHE